VYACVYESVLRHRRVQILTHDVILPTRELSVYDFSVTPRDLVPTDRAVAERFIREVERRYPDPSELDAELARWWQT
jgi:hypothetical protein